MGLFNPDLNPTQRIFLPGLTTANSSTILPARAIISQIFAVNNTGNAVTGGLKFGTTNGGVDIVAALTVAASVASPPATLLLPRFATQQQIFIDAAISWNSANVDITILYVQT